MNYRERYAEIVKAGRRESKNIGQKAQNAVIDTFALMDDADAEIAALRAGLERKDAALKEVLVGDSNISAWGRRIVEDALQPKEPPCQTA